MAKAFPKSEFYGFDLHPASIEAANRHAREQQIMNVHFSTASAKDFAGNDYGLVTVFDALHDMGDPVGAASHVKQFPANRWHIHDCGANRCRFTR
jgi:hypothetical protein